MYLLAGPLPRRLFKQPASRHRDRCSYPYTATHTDADSAHLHGHGYVQPIGHSDQNPDARATWLPEAARRVHAYSSARLDGEPTHTGDAGTRAGTVWR